MDYDRAELTAEILKAVAHPVRLIVLNAIAEDEKTVSELNRLVNIDQSTLSRHLAQLKRAGLVSERRDGTRIYHRLANPCVLQLQVCAEEVLSCHLEKQRRKAGM